MVKKMAVVLALSVLVLAAQPLLAQDEALQSIGALGAGYMYRTYLVIGTVADGHVYEIYDDETTIQLMEEIIGFANVSNESLRELVGSGKLTIDDFNYVNEMVSTLELLRN